MAVRQKVIWLQDKGRNAIGNDSVIGDLLNVVAAWRDPNTAPKILMPKEFASPSMTIEEKLKTLTPPLLKVPCPLAEHLGIPLALYAYGEAKAGDPPVKGDTNMIAQLLSRRFDGTNRAIKGKALVCLEKPLPGAGLDLPVDLLVKLLFFTADLVRDVFGSSSNMDATEREEKMKLAGLFFQFYGPGRNVTKGMTELLIRNPQNASAPPQVFTVEMLKQQFEAGQRQQMQQQQKQGMPQFMTEAFMQDPKYLGELKQVVLRGWTPPSSTRDDDDKAADMHEGKDAGDAAGDAETKSPTESGGGLDFSDLS